MKNKLEMHRGNDGESITEIIIPRNFRAFDLILHWRLAYSYVCTELTFLTSISG